MLDQPNNQLDRVYRVLKQYWQVGIAVAVTVGVSAFSAQSIALAVSASWSTGVVTVLLFIMTVVWFIAYIHSTIAELEILQDHEISPVFNSTAWLPALIIIVIAFCFGLLITFVVNPLKYSATAIVLIAINAIGFSFVQKAIARATEDNNRQRVLNQEIIRYYLFRPFMLHQMGIVVGFFTAFVLSLLATYDQGDSFRLVAGITLIVTIVIGETVVATWRRKRDRNMGS